MNELKAPSQKPWMHSSDRTLEALKVAAEKGLDSNEVVKRQNEYGRNRLHAKRKRNAWLILIYQFKSLIIGLLTLAAVLSFLFDDFIEGGAIIIVILINAAIGFLIELKAVRSMEALYGLSQVSAKVRRNREILEIPAEELVPGDIVVFEGGDVNSADLRLIEASKLQSDESTLTGESIPVSKHIDSLLEDTPLAERKNMLFKGTFVTRGSGEGVVVATGMQTELGRISALVEEADAESTPLEKRLDQLGHSLVWVTLGITTFVAAVGIFRGKNFFLMIQTAIALAVAAIPEGLPIVATIALARGMMRMARRNALINRLSAVETLGATNIIFTDKTGTLTENQMTVTQIALESGNIDVTGEGLELTGEFRKNGSTLDSSQDQLLQIALEVAALCNNASLKRGVSKDQNEAVGDPLEIALLVAAAKAKIDRDSLAARMPELREEAFDPETKMMATLHKENGEIRVAVKGAPEAVLACCTSIMTDQEQKKMSQDIRNRWLERNKEMAQLGLRMLAVAIGNVDSEEAKPFENLCFIGLLGLLDPPRGEVRQTIETCRKAGIRVIMVTGDHVITAQNIGRAVGLIDEKQDLVVEGKEIKGPKELSDEDRNRLLRAPIFARVTPEQKLDLIALYQKNGSIVAMTGDGVNDAPALKKADIGIAMGKRGTQVAKEAADMVLQDDSFHTITVAIEQGRIIFNNIRKFVIYLLSCNVSEILIVAIASFLNTPLPLLPLQILFLNIVTDVFPALALGMGKGDPEVMNRPPRDPRESILTRHDWAIISWYGIIIVISVLTALIIAYRFLGMQEKQAVTISFLTLAFAQLWHVFNMRDPDSRIFRNDIVMNVHVWLALAWCTLLLVSAVYLPIVANSLKVENPGTRGWILVLAMSSIPFIVGQVIRRLRLA